MSEETENYLVYDIEQDAWDKADAEGIAQRYPYHTVGGTTRYKTSPKLTADNKWALKVNGYISLTEDEESAITTSVTFPAPEEV